MQSYNSSSLPLRNLFVIDHYFTICKLFNTSTIEDIRTLELLTMTNKQLRDVIYSNTDYLIHKNEIKTKKIFNNLCDNIEKYGFEVIKDDRNNDNIILYLKNINDIAPLMCQYHIIDLNTKIMKLFWVWDCYSTQISLKYASKEQAIILYKIIKKIDPDYILKYIGNFVYSYGDVTKILNSLKYFVIYLDEDEIYEIDTDTDSLYYEENFDY